MKPGWKTTEFALALVAAILAALISSGALETGSVWDTAISLASMALASMGYSFSRGKAKAAASLAPELNAEKKTD